MTTKARSLLKEALNLSRSHRAALAERLLDSLEQDETILAAAKEADRRWQAFQRGEAGAKSFEQVIENLRRKKKK